MMQLPSVDLSYLRSITDCTGIIQHGVHGVPNRKLGYTTDDNCRALIVAAKQYERTGDRADLDLALTYLSFVHYAESPDHTFRNVMTYQREFLDDAGTEDCYGRTMWACGYTVSSGLPENVRIVAQKIFDAAVIWAGDLSSPRARAYTMLGMCHYLKTTEDSMDLQDKIHALADSLTGLLRTASDKDWHWYEPYMTYGNAILPSGMFVAAEVTGKKTYLNAAISTTDFLTEVLFPNGYLDIVGNNGWYIKDRAKAIWDQQTIDAGYTVCLYVQAYRITRNKAYADLARCAYEWFFGKNRREIYVYDPVSKGCYDAVCEHGVNLNQGAESCISFLLAQLAIEELDTLQDINVPVGGVYNERCRDNEKVSGDCKLVGHN
mgnify:CR=1 FL=1